MLDLCTFGAEDLDPDEQGPTLSTKTSAAGRIC